MPISTRQKLFSRNINIKRSTASYRFQNTPYVRNSHLLCNEPNNKTLKKQLNYALWGWGRQPTRTRWVDGRYKDKFRRRFGLSICNSIRRRRLRRTRRESAFMHQYIVVPLDCTRIAGTRAVHSRAGLGRLTKRLKDHDPRRLRSVDFWDDGWPHDVLLWLPHRRRLGVLGAGLIVIAAFNIRQWWWWW